MIAYFYDIIMEVGNRGGGFSCPDCQHMAKKLGQFGILHLEVRRANGSDCVYSHSF